MRKTDIEFFREIEAKDPATLNRFERILLEHWNGMEAELAGQREDAERAAQEDQVLEDRRADVKEAERIVEEIKTRASLLYILQTDPRDRHSNPPTVIEAAFKTDLGHPGKIMKPIVLNMVAGSAASRCGGLRIYPGQKQFRGLFQTAWERYDTPGFEIRGEISCANPTHRAHQGTAIFTGLRMKEDLGIDERLGTASRARGDASHASGGTGADSRGGPGTGRASEDDGRRIMTFAMTGVGLGVRTSRPLRVCLPCPTILMRPGRHEHGRKPSA